MKKDWASSVHWPELNDELSKLLDIAITMEMMASRHKTFADISDETRFDGLARHARAIIRRIGEFGFQLPDEYAYLSHVVDLVCQADQFTGERSWFAVCSCGARSKPYATQDEADAAHGEHHRYVMGGEFPGVRFAESRQEAP